MESASSGRPHGTAEFEEMMLLAFQQRHPDIEESAKSLMLRLRRNEETEEECEAEEQEKLKIKGFEDWQKNKVATLVNCLKRSNREYA